MGPDKVRWGPVGSGGIRRDPVGPNEIRWDLVSIEASRSARPCLLPMAAGSACCPWLLVLPAAHGCWFCLLPMAAGSDCWLKGKVGLDTRDH